MLLARELYFAGFRLKFRFLIPEKVSETKTLGTLISSRICPFTIQRSKHALKLAQILSRKIIVHSDRIEIFEIAIRLFSILY